MDGTLTFSCSLPTRSSDHKIELSKNAVDLCLSRLKRSRRLQGEDGGGKDSEKSERGECVASGVRAGILGRLSLSRNDRLSTHAFADERGSLALTSAGGVRVGSQVRLSV